MQIIYITLLRVSTVDRKKSEKFRLNCEQQKKQNKPRFDYADKICIIAYSMYFTEKEYCIIERMVYYHAGTWQTEKSVTQ